MFSIQPFDREGRMHQNQCIKSILGSLIQHENQNLSTVKADLLELFQ